MTVTIGRRELLDPRSRPTRPTTPRRHGMTKGVLLRIFMLEGQRHHSELLYDWLLRRAREMGITGGAAFREIAGYGRHERLHEQFFFELAGDLPVEVVFAMTQSDSQKFLDLLAREKLSLFYISSPCEFGHVGE
jgi:uncharacterized protein